MKGILLREFENVVVVVAGSRETTYDVSNIKFFNEKFIVAEAGEYWFLGENGDKSAAAVTDWMFATSIKELSFCHYFGHIKYFKDNFNRSEVYKNGRNKPKYEFRILY